MVPTGRTMGRCRLQRRAQRPAGPSKEGLVFVVGGGSYLEGESLACWAARAVPAPKNIIYGATELLSGGEFLGQLAELGRRSGAAAGPS